MAKAKQRPKKSEGAINEKPDVNMTPMIDVTFLLIIFFICLKFKTLEGKLAAFLPKDVGVNTTSAKPMEKIDVHIHNVDKGTFVKTGERKVWTKRKVKWQVDTQVYFTAEELEKGLKVFKEQRLNPKKPGEPLPVTIHAHKDVFYGEVTRTVDHILHVGFKEVTFAGGYTN